MGTQQAAAAARSERHRHSYTARLLCRLFLQGAIARNIKRWEDAMTLLRPRRAQHPVGLQADQI